jgi:hypothetical protein
VTLRPYGQRHQAQPPEERVMGPFMNLPVSDTQRSANDLIRIAQTTTAEQRRTLREFYEHYHDNPELLPFLRARALEQIRQFGWVCFDAAWSAALMELQTPGGPKFKLPAQLKAWYVRALLYCHPDLNGWLEVRYSEPDRVFGMAIAEKLSEDYAARVEWCDGRALEAPAIAALKPITIKLEPAQGELFEVAE